MIKPEFSKRDIRSFVIRGGRITTAQKSAFEKYWPLYGLQLADGKLDYLKTFGKHQPLVLEIGYGMGDSLLQMSLAETEKNFIGIEVHPPGVGHLVNEAGKKQIGNLKTYCADAIDVLTECIAEESVDRVQLYFPDPWHKKRHHKRRIVQEQFVRLVVSRLKVGGVFHLCTDWVPYAEHMLEVLRRIETIENLSKDNAYCEQPAWRPKTKFERRGEKLGHEVRDLLFQKK